MRKVILLCLLIVLAQSIPKRFRRIVKELETIDADKRTEEEIKSANAIIFPNVDPVPLNDEQLLWMTVRHKLEVKRLVDKGANKWEELQKIADVFYDEHQSRRAMSQKALEEYCYNNLVKIITEDDLKHLEHLYKDSATPEHLESEFSKILSSIQDKQQTILAERYGDFCKKILRIVPIDSHQLLSWLNSDQKDEIELMIIKEDITDDDIYEKIYHFFNETVNKEEAKTAIDGACKRFIADLFGDDIVEDMELMKNRRMKPQLVAYTLHQHIKEVDSQNTAKNNEKSLWLCEQIYVGYSGDCQCGGRADECDDRKACINCRGNTAGAMCQRCIDGYQWALEGDRCVEPCECYGHAAECDDYGVCQNCTDNTHGRSCQYCIDGFLGNPKNRNPNDCKECTCRLDEECVSNGDGEIECIEPIEAIFGHLSSNETDSDTMESVSSDPLIDQNEDTNIENNGQEDINIVNNDETSDDLPE